MEIISFTLKRKWNSFDFFCSKLFMSPVNIEQGSNYPIKLIRTEIMECVIDFAYTFMCDINERNVGELITTAEYFCYTSLIDRCAKFIASILNAKNCIALMIMTRFSYESFSNFILNFSLNLNFYLKLHSLKTKISFIFRCSESVFSSTIFSVKLGITFCVILQRSPHRIRIYWVYHAMTSSKF